MEFILGCNYWASNAGAEMWRNFDEIAIEKDMSVLSENGVKDIRVFPNWRDFQPVMPLMSSKNTIDRYCLEGEKEPTNPYYLDDEKMEQFSVFLDICQKYGIRVIVGLLTGWMSGRTFVPSALYEKNLITDPVALWFEQLFIEGFVKAFKSRSEIIAWDLGNECNCMSLVQNKLEAASWTYTVANAIRANDGSRPVISGMHSLELEDSKPWRIQEQSFVCDMLTTHPYPFWCMHTRIDEIASLRTTLHATAQGKMYAEISKKGCLAEEIGTMGPMLSDNDNAANFLRANLFSLWANGATGVMWWCSSDQEKLDTYPYTVQCVERELGLMDSSHNPKPVLKELKKFSDFLSSEAPILPQAREDGVCILTKGQDQWGTAFMTYILAKQAGLNIRFEYGENELPESRLYMLPSVNGYTFMTKNRFDELKKKVFEGADLYISANNIIIPGFEEFTGLKVVDSFESVTGGSVSVEGCEIPFSKIRAFRLECTNAEAIACDSEGNPCITVNQYGKGRVFFVNFPLESSLIEKHNAFNGNEHKIYSSLLGEHKASYPLTVSGKDVMFTYHQEGDREYAVIINHSAESKNPAITLADGYEIEDVIYGNPDMTAGFDACVISLRKLDTKDDF